MTDQVCLAAHLPVAIRKKPDAFTLEASAIHHPFKIRVYIGQPLLWYSDKRFLHKRAPKGTTHYLIDNDGDTWHLGTEASCKKYLMLLECHMARRNLAWAMTLMTRGTKAEGL